MKGEKQKILILIEKISIKVYGQIIQNIDAHTKLQNVSECTFIKCIFAGIYRLIWRFQCFYDDFNLKFSSAGNITIATCIYANINIILIFV